MPAVIESTLYDAPPPGGSVIAGSTQQNSRDDLRLGYHVTLRSVHEATTYSWSLSFASDSPGSTVPGTPFDGTQSISALLPPENNTSRDAKFNVDFEGSYLIRLTIDASLPTEDTQFIRCRALTVFGALKLVAAGERRDDQGIIPVDASAEGWANDHNANMQRVAIILRRVSSSGRVLFVDSNRGRSATYDQNDYDNVLSLPGPESARPEETGIKLRAMGHGDFSSINEAIAYAAAAAGRGEPAPSFADPYFIMVRPGLYEEDLNLTSFVHLIAMESDGGQHAGTANASRPVLVRTVNTAGTGTHRYNPLVAAALGECILSGIHLENTANTTSPVVDQLGGTLLLKGCSVHQKGDAVNQGEAIRAVTANVAHAPTLWMSDTAVLQDATTADRAAITLNAPKGAVETDKSLIRAASCQGLVVNGTLYDESDASLSQTLIQAVKPYVGYANEQNFWLCDMVATGGNPAIDVSPFGNGAGAKAGDVEVVVHRTYLEGTISFATLGAAGDTKLRMASVLHGVSGALAQRVLLPDAPGDTPTELSGDIQGDSLAYDSAYITPAKGPGGAATINVANQLPVASVQEAIDFLARATFPVTGSPFFSLDSSYDGLQSMSPWVPGSGLGRYITADAGAVSISGASAPIGIASHLKTGGIQAEGVGEFGPLITGAGSQTMVDVGHAEISLNPNMMGAGPFISLGRASWVNGITGGNRGFGGAVVLADVNPNTSTAFNLHLRTADARTSPTGRLGNVYLSAGSVFDPASATVGGDVHVIAGSTANAGGAVGDIYLVPGSYPGALGGVVTFVGAGGADAPATLQAGAVWVGGQAGTIFIGTPNGVEQFVFTGAEANAAAAVALFNATARAFVASEAGGQISLHGVANPSSDIIYIGDTVSGALNRSLGNLSVSALAAPVVPAGTFTAGTYGWEVDVDVNAAGRLRVDGDLEVTGTIIGGGPAFGTYVTVTTAMSPYAVASGVGIMDFDSTVGVITADLPQASANKGRLLLFKHISGANIIDINVFAGDTIDGFLTTYQLVGTTNGHAIGLYSDGGSNWQIWTEYKRPAATVRFVSGNRIWNAFEKHEIYSVQLGAGVDITITLHTDMEQGRKITIKDQNGIANAIPSPVGQKIIIVDGGGGNFDGGALEITSAYGSVTMFKTTTGDWAII